MRIQHEPLERLVRAIFAAAGCRGQEAECIARHLVEANLVGHDSHGVIRVAPYIQWLREGKVLANQAPRVVFENDCIAVVDGQFGFGQPIGEYAMQIGIEKSSRHGVAVVAVRNCGHLGRIGDWALLAADANKFSLHFVNTSGAGILVAPFGGINRRLSANPIAAGVPIQGGSPIILDISTSAVAEGKIRVALNKGVNVPDASIIDSEGRPTNDPKVFYGTPPGAILPFGGHKGYALGIIAEMLAGALTGNACTTPGVTRLSNGMLSVFMEPTFFQREDELAQEIKRFVAFVKGSATTTPGGEILMPGEPEERTRAERLRDGIELDDRTWGQIIEAAASVQISRDTIDSLLGGRGADGR